MYTGELGRAESIFSEVLHCVQELGNNRDEAESLVALAKLAARRSDYQGAASLCADACKVLLGVPVAIARVSCLNCAAVILARMDRPREAALLFHIVEQSRSPLPEPIPPSEFQTYAEHRRKLREDLGEVAYSAVAADAAKIGIGAAIALALDALQESRAAYEKKS
jgi:hypothetical protein